MRLVKVPAMNLQPGMFVAELDRPWLDTPFSLQGFVVRDTSEVLYVSKYVEHVYVDEEYKGQGEFLTLDTAPTAIDPRERLDWNDCSRSPTTSLAKPCRWQSPPVSQKWVGRARK